MEGDLVSYAFTPPEWSKSKNALTAESDVWSLGASAFNLINGSFVFNGRGSVMQKENTKIPSLRRDIYSEELSDVISKCLSYNPQDRPSPKELIVVAKRMLEKSYVKEHKINTFKNNNPTNIHEDIWPEKMI